MIDLKKNHKQLTPKCQGIAEYSPEHFLPANSLIKKLIYDDKVTPEMIEKLKENYARAVERLHLNFNCMMQFNIEDWKPEWIKWTFCEIPAICAGYARIFRLLREVGTFYFMEREMNRGFYMIEHVFEPYEGEKQK